MPWHGCFCWKVLLGLLGNRQEVFKFQTPFFYCMISFFMIKEPGRPKKKLSNIGKFLHAVELRLNRSQKIMDKFNNLPKSKALIAKVDSLAMKVDRMTAKKEPLDQACQEKVRNLLVRESRLSLAYCLKLQKFAKFSKANHSFFKSLDLQIESARRNIEQAKQWEP